MPIDKDDLKASIPLSMRPAAARAELYRQAGLTVPEGLVRLEIQAKRAAEILDRARAPEEMQAAPIAPARGTMRLEENYTVSPGGMRRRDGAHWRGASVLEAMVAAARAKHRASGSSAPFEPQFSPGQLSVAGDYRALVEWRAGSAIKCSSLEGSRSGGGGSGLFIDGFIDQGKWLDELHRRIGPGFAIEVQRGSIDGRRSIPIRRALDRVVLHDMHLAEVLRIYGWAGGGANRRRLILALGAALDRMQGYKGDRDTK